MRRFITNLFGSRQNGEEAAPNPAPPNNDAQNPPEQEQEPEAEPEHVILHGSVTNSLLHTIPNPERLDQTELCSICQEALLERHGASVPIVETTCGHRFCSPCINGHMHHRATHGSRIACPLCNLVWNIIWDPDGEQPAPPRGAVRRWEERRGAVVFDENQLLLPMVREPSVRRPQSDRSDDAARALFVAEAFAQDFWPDAQ